MNKLFFLGAILLSFIFFGCNRYDEIAVNIEQLPDDKTEFLLYDSIILKGENLHKVTGVHFLDGNNEVEGSFLNLNNDYYKTRNWKENEMLLRLPYYNYTELFGKEVELVLGFNQNTKDGEVYQEHKTGFKMKILAPSIKSISRYEFNDLNPSYIVLDNFKKEYSQPAGLEIVQYYKITFNDGVVEYNWNRPDFTIISDDSIRIDALYRNGSIIMHFNWEQDYNDIRNSRADYTLKTDSLTMYYSYNIPKDQVYAPGSFMVLSGTGYTNKHGGFSQATVGGYSVENNYDGFGKKGIYLPSTIQVNEEDQFEIILSKEEGFLNYDNSHNFIEFVHGQYRVVDEDEKNIFIETTAYYTHLNLDYGIVSSVNDTIWYDYMHPIDGMKEPSASNFALGISKMGMPKGDHQLLMFTGDRKYQLKPAGNISFTVE